MNICVVDRTTANGAMRYLEAKWKISPNVIDIGRVGRARWTMPSISVVMHRPYRGGGRVSECVRVSHIM